MATIDKIGAILNTKIEIPFKVKARESIHVNNPFRDSKFDEFNGSILPADIFEGSQLKSQNKAKMVMSAIAGSVSSFSKKIVEPVAAFCNKVKTNVINAKTNVSNALNYARTTTLSAALSDLGNSISGKISTMRKNAEMSKISDSMPVPELESAWINENIKLMEAA